MGNVSSLMKILVIHGFIDTLVKLDFPAHSMLYGPWSQKILINYETL